MTNLQALTPDQVRDWLAEQRGWKYEPSQIDGMGHQKDYWWKYTISPEHGGRTYNYGHPFPATLDGAASAMPEGWWWHKYHQTPRGLEYSAGRKGEKGYTFAPDTGNEINDRHLLAALAVQAEMETKR